MLVQNRLKEVKLNMGLLAKIMGVKDNNKIKAYSSWLAFGTTGFRENRVELNTEEITLMLNYIGINYKISDDDRLVIILNHVPDKLREDKKAWLNEIFSKKREAKTRLRARK